jgi:hypothetical protein
MNPAPPVIRMFFGSYIEFSKGVGSKVVIIKDLDQL